MPVGLLLRGSGKARAKHIHSEKIGRCVGSYWILRIFLTLVHFRCLDLILALGLALGFSGHCQGVSHVHPLKKDWL